MGVDFGNMNAGHFIFIPAVLLLNEPWDWQMVLGALVTVSGLAIIVIRRPQSAPPRRRPPTPSGSRQRPHRAGAPGCPAAASRMRRCACSTSYSMRGSVSVRASLS
jgi:hypothetical protein